jgi:hypothetical protein
MRGACRDTWRLTNRRRSPLSPFVAAITRGACGMRNASLERRGRISTTQIRLISFGILCAVATATAAHAKDIIVGPLSLGSAGKPHTLPCFVLNIGSSPIDITSIQ